MMARPRTWGADLGPHFYEMFVVANLVAAHLFVRANGSTLIVGNLAMSTVMFGRALGVALLAGVALRAAGATLTGDRRGYLRQIARWTWWLESARLVLFGAIAIHVYTHLKVLMPRLTTRNADALLWQIDRTLLGGHSPSVLAVELLRNPVVVRAVDWSYGNVFTSTLWIVFMVALSSPSQRIRVAFVGAKAAMWVAGAWLYYTLPSLGPAYRFHGVWSGLAGNMPYTVATLRALMENYLVVLGAGRGRVDLLLGIAAFPSLHVAFQTFVALWVRRFTRLGGAIAIAAAILVFIGSVLTGWHYLIDSIAGVALAVAVYWILFRTYRLGRWIRLLRRIRGPRRRFEWLAP